MCRRTVFVFSSIFIQLSAYNSKSPNERVFSLYSLQSSFTSGKQLITFCFTNLGYISTKTFSKYEDAMVCAHYKQWTEITKFHAFSKRCIETVCLISKMASKMVSGRNAPKSVFSGDSFWTGIFSKTEEWLLYDDYGLKDFSHVLTLWDKMWKENKIPGHISGFLDCCKISNTRMNVY